MASDVIVVGAGGMGSAACWHLARRGRRVLDLERFDIPHAMGSSHGVTRIIRPLYHEDPAYVPLLRRAYALWRELEAASACCSSRARLPVWEFRASSSAATATAPNAAPRKRCGARRLRAAPG